MLDMPPFEVLSDGEKISFLMDALAEVNEALQAANALIAELSGINDELIVHLKGGAEND